MRFAITKQYIRVESKQHIKTFDYFMLSKTKIWKLGLIAFFFISISAEFYFGKKRDKKDDLFFNSSRISGRLVDVYGGSGGDQFKVNNSEKGFKFQSILSVENHYDEFSRLAEIGDSVNKEPFRNTNLNKKIGKDKLVHFSEVVDK